MSNYSSKPKQGRHGKGKTPAVMTPAQKAAATRKANEARKQALEKANAVRLAQIVNLHIAGYSMHDIAQSIGASVDEVERLLNNDVSKYVRSQPALRIYVRNWLNEKWTALLEADWDIATDKNHSEKLEHQDRVFRILDRMERLNGASAPVQTEVTIDAAPEAVEKLVAALSATKGVGYDTSIFDVVDAEVVHDAAEAAHEGTVVSGNALEASDGEDDL